MMSRRKQQNPKPLKYNESPDLGSSGTSGSTDENIREISNSSPSLKSPTSDSQPSQAVEDQPVIKDEPRSPEQPVPSASPLQVDDLPNGSSPTRPPGSLENLLGVPDDAPLRVEKSHNGGYKILSAKYIGQGAGLDPLKAQKIESFDDRSLDDKPQVVSFVQRKRPEGKVYFRLDSSINCAWLKCLGEPREECIPNINIYYAGDQLWVEVVEDLKEGEELIAEFREHDRRQRLSPKEDSLRVATSTPSRAAVKSQSPPTVVAMEAQFPCLLCGVQFRNPNTLMAHKKHYCSKLASPTSTTVTMDQDAASVSNETEAKDMGEMLQQTAFICLVCKFMSLTECDMKSHVREKHKVKEQADSGPSHPFTGVASGSDKTYCDDCEIHFKKPESYQAHKQHYCKNRTNSNSPRSDSGGNHSISQSSSPRSPIAKESYYKKVSVFDNQALSASLATQAAAAMAASIPFTLSSMLSLPGMAALPMMPSLKMFQSPALFAQAMQSAVKATSTAPSGSTNTTSHREETPLDLTVKSDLSNDGTAILPTKRRASGEPEDVRPSKHRLSGSSPTSPAAAIPSTISSILSQRINGQMKPLKPERPIYRCESCSIPFYKKDVYEAHRLHYCSRRPSSSGSEKEEETPIASKPSGKPDRHSPITPTDERLVITYTCNKCSTSYRTIETFKAHQCAVPSAPLPLLRCDDCSFSTQSSRKLAEHADTHQKVNLMYKCKLCGYHGNTLRGMRQHGRQHMLKGEEFNDDDVETLELQPSKPLMPPLAVSVPYSVDVDEELLRLKNEPYKKRRSRKHYQKSEYMSTTISPQRKENGLQHRSRSSSPHSTSTASCISPLQMSTINIVHDRPVCSPTAVSVKQEPIENQTANSKMLVVHPVEHRPAVPDKVTPMKRYVCSCNTSFASVSTFEAHKKLYCPHHKSQRSNPTITVNH